MIEEYTHVIEEYTHGKRAFRWADGKVGYRTAYEAVQIVASGPSALEALNRAMDIARADKIDAAAIAASVQYDAYSEDYYAHLYLDQ